MEYQVKHCSHQNAIAIFLRFSTKEKYEPFSLGFTGALVGFIISIFVAGACYAGSAATLVTSCCDRAIVYLRSKDRKPLPPNGVPPLRMERKRRPLELPK